MPNYTFPVRWAKNPLMSRRMDQNFASTVAMSIQGIALEQYDGIGRVDHVRQFFVIGRGVERIANRRRRSPGIGRLWDRGYTRILRLPNGERRAWFRPSLAHIARCRGQVTSRDWYRQESFLGFVFPRRAHKTCL